MPESLGVHLDTTELDALAARLNTSAGRAVAAIAEQVKGLAAALAPVDTGALRNSIHTEKESELLYIAADAVEHGIWQELGTSKTAAHPFMVPAVEQGYDHVAQIMAGEIFG